MKKIIIFLLFTPVCCVVAPGVEDINDCIIQEYAIEQSSGEELAKRALAYISQNERFSPSEYNASVSFNNYCYWLGLRNYDVGYFRRSVMAFIFAKGDKIQENIKFYNLAIANASVGSASTGQTKYEYVIPFYERIIEQLPFESKIGKAVCLKQTKDPRPCFLTFPSETNRTRT